MTEWKWTTYAIGISVPKSEGLDEGGRGHVARLEWETRRYERKIARRAEAAMRDFCSAKGDGE